MKHHRPQQSGPAIQTQTPRIEAQEVEIDRYFWPKDKPLPKEYAKAPRQIVPCPKCRRIFLDNMGQAVACKSSGADVAYFQCKACDHSFKLAVREIV